MKTVKLGRYRQREYDVPETWDEAYEMLVRSMEWHSSRGGNAGRLSAVVRVAYGMFGDRFSAPDPTTAAVYLLREICKREGAGLDG